MKILKYLIAFILVITFFGMLLVNFYPGFGTRPNEEDRLTFQQSKQYNSEKNIFENTDAKVFSEMKKRSFNWKILKEFFSAGKDRVPSGKLAEVKPKIDHFLKSSDDLKVIWFGHSSFMLNMDGTIVLVDPVFSNASPFSFGGKRFQEPVLTLNELPEVDYVVISHDHYDHLDMDSVKFFADKDTTFIVPLGVGSHLKGWGISNDKVIEKDWWQTASFAEIDFIATPAQHFSGRDGIHENETLWASWVIKSKNHNIYFSGDTGYSDHFKQIGEKHGPFDVAFLENGQYNEAWREIHMLPEETALASKDLRAAKLFPVHWGMFELALHSWHDPIEKIFKIAKEQEINLVAPQLGQIVNLNSDNIQHQWWKQQTGLMFTIASNFHRE